MIIKDGEIFYASRGDSIHVLYLRGQKKLHHVART